MSVGYAYAALAAYQLVSGAQQAETIREQGRLNKEIADVNAEYAELDAYNAEQSGYTQEARYQHVIDSTLSHQRVAQASQNVDVSFGTAKELQAETKLNGFLNQLDIKNQAHQQALGYKMQARNIRLAGVTGKAQAEYNAGATQNAAIIGAAGTALSGYAKTAAPSPSPAPSPSSSPSNGSYTLGSGSYLGFNSKF